MTRYGAQFGPDITFLGVPAIDVDDVKALADADIVIVGAPFDGGTSFRAGARLGPSAIRELITCHTMVRVHLLRCELMDLKNLT